MFAYYFASVHGSFEEVERGVLAALDGPSEHAEVAYRHGEELRARMGPSDHGIAKTVRLRVGEPRRSTDETAIPLVWEATGPRVLFPRMDADLVLSSIGPELTHLVFRGSYRPPLGPVGRALDRSLLHRVAEASIKHFVDGLALAAGRLLEMDQASGR
jgi:hypothetical protein